MCLVKTKAYMKSAEEHKEIEYFNVKERLEMAILMAETCSMLEDGMGPGGLGYAERMPRDVPEVRMLCFFLHKKAIDNYLAMVNIEACIRLNMVILDL